MKNSYFVIAIILLLVWRLGYVMLQTPPSTAVVKSADSDARLIAETDSFPIEIFGINLQAYAKQHGCISGAERYFGFADNGQQQRFVVANADEQQVYSAGDLLTDNSIIISGDSDRLLLRSGSQLMVLCDQSKVTESVNSKPNYAPVNNDYLTLQPEIETNGQLLGYRFQKCQSYCQVIQLFGLKEGDLITHFQGKSIDSWLTKDGQFQFKNKQEDIVLRVKRGSDDLTITLPYKKIASYLTHFMSTKAY